MSAWSAQVDATVLSTPNITAPTSFNAARGDEQITLTWSAPSNLAGLTIARYDYRFRESGGTWSSWTDAGNDGTETVTGLTNGTTYEFELLAVSTTGAEGATASTSGTTSTAPGSPTLSASATYNSVTLTWTAPSDNGGAAITAYLIQRANDDGTWTDRATRPGSATTSWTDSGLTRSTEYTYRIFARNVAGDSDWTSATIVTLAQAPVVPSAPTAGSLAAGPGNVTLSWEAPAFNGGSAITEYSYRYKERNNRTWRGWFSVGTETEVTIDNLKPLTLHDFEVRARNSAGYGPVLELDGTPLAKMPTSAPTTLEGEVSDTDTANDGLALDVELEWTPLTATDTTLNGGSTITGYDVQWKTSDGDDEAWASVVTVGTLNQDANSTDHEDVSPGTTYQYRIRATNTVMVGDPTWSNVVSVEVDPNAPGAPADPTLDPDVNSITISWAAPMTTVQGQDPVVNDGGSAITSYEIWVGVASVEIDTEIDALTPTIKNLAPTRTEYTHTGLKSEVTYYYRVRAVNGASRDDGIGPWSAEVNTDYHTGDCRYA